MKIDFNLDKINLISTKNTNTGKVALVSNVPKFYLFHYSIYRTKFLRLLNILASTFVKKVKQKLF